MLLEEEFILNQERLKPSSSSSTSSPGAGVSGGGGGVGRDKENTDEAERTKVDDLRGSPMAVGKCEEIVDDEHAIISTPSGPEYYVSIMSFVDKDLLEPGCTVLLHQKNHAIVGVLEGDVDPMVSVMKLDKAPSESYADVGGLDQQIQEIKVFGDLFSFGLIIMME